MSLFHQDFLQHSWPSINRGAWDYEDDFSSDNWTDADATNIGVGSGVLSFDSKKDGSNDKSYYDYGSTVSDTAWVLRFKSVLSTVTQGSLNPEFHIFTGLASGTGSASVSQDHILWDYAANNFDGLLYQFQSRDNDTYGANSTGLNTMAHTLQAETTYNELIRTSATTATGELFSDSGYSTSVESESITIPSNVTNLRYISVANLVGTGGDSVIIGSYDDMKFADGVTVAP